MIIWLASYPRSGNTFIRTILNHAFQCNTYSIYGDTFDISADSKTKELIGHEDLPEDFDFEAARQSDAYYFIKTHEPFCKDYAADHALYIVRDGREATVSYSHYLKNFSPNHFTIPEIINGFPFMGSWGGHVQSWASAPSPQRLTLKFEEIIRDPDSAIDAIAALTGLTPDSRTIPGFGDLQNTNPAFFRSGKTDSFTTELSEWEHHYFWMVNGQGMRQAGYESARPDPDSAERDELVFLHTSLEGRKVLKHAEAPLFRRVRQLEASLSAREHTIREKEMAMQKLSAENASLAHQLNSIRASRTARLAGLYSSLFRRP